MRNDEKGIENLEIEKNRKEMNCDERKQGSKRKIWTVGFFSNTDRQRRYT